jgi:hypothetical protein
MSMKRSKEVSRGRAREVDGGFWDKKEPERVYTWESDVSAQPDEAFVAYTPQQRYSKDVLLTHAKFGKGIVTDVDGGKIDVLFQEGPKKLTHGLAGGPVIQPKPLDEMTESQPAAITVPAPPPIHMPDEPPAAALQQPQTFEPPPAAPSDPTLDDRPAPAAAPSDDQRQTLDPPTDPDPNASGGTA